MENSYSSEESQDQNQKQNIGSGNSNALLIPGAIIVAGVLIAGAVIYTNTPRSDSIVAGNGKNAAVVGTTVENTSGAVVADLSDDDPSLGNPEAAVTLVEFGDFQCPFCARLFHETLPQIKEQYVKTGKVRFVYRDFPLSSIHAMAQKAAEAAECADEQEKFWPYHDMLYQRQQSLSIANFKTWASEIGLNSAQFDACLDSGKYTDEVQKDLSAGQLAGVTGTPATFVNGRLISGAVPFETFKAVIEEELGKIQ